MGSVLPCCTGAFFFFLNCCIASGADLSVITRSLLKLAIHSASSAPTMNVKKVSDLYSLARCAQFFDGFSTKKVHALIRNEFERHKNESRPEVVEVCGRKHGPFT